MKTISSVFKKIPAFLHNESCIQRNYMHKKRGEQEGFGIFDVCDYCFACLPDLS